MPMKIISTFFNLLDQINPAQAVYAHCDVPCGIYDPYPAQIAAHTVIRMINLINDLQASSENPDFAERKRIIHSLSRYTATKEEHAEIVKREIRILWGDYFKEEHLKQFPNLQEAVFHTIKLASKARQEINLETAKELLEHVQEIASIFWKTKGLEPTKVKAPYPTEFDLIVPKYK